MNNKKLKKENTSNLKGKLSKLLAFSLTPQEQANIKGGVTSGTSTFTDILIDNLEDFAA